MRKKLQGVQTEGRCEVIEATHAISCAAQRSCGLDANTLTVYTAHHLRIRNGTLVARAEPVPLAEELELCRDDLTMCSSDLADCRAELPVRVADLTACRDERSSMHT